MNIYLPIAEISVNVFLLLGMGGAVGFLSGLFGVGGGFLMTPLLIFIGVTPAVAVATEANQIVASSVSGVLAHMRRGNVDVRMFSVTRTADASPRATTWSAAAWACFSPTSTFGESLPPHPVRTRAPAIRAAGSHRRRATRGACRGVVLSDVHVSRLPFAFQTRSGHHYI